MNPPAPTSSPPAAAPSQRRVLAGTVASAAYALACGLLLWLQPRSPWTVAAFLLPVLAFACGWLWRRGWRAAAVLLAVAVPAALLACLQRCAPQAHLLYVAEYVAVYGALSAWFAGSLAGTPLITRVARRVHPLTPDMQAYTVRLTRAWAIYFAAMAALSLATFGLLGLRAWTLFTLMLSPLSLGVFVVGEHFLRYRWHPEFDRASLRQTIRTWREGQH